MEHTSRVPIIQPPIFTTFLLVSVLVQVLLEEAMWWCIFRRGKYPYWCIIVRTFMFNIILSCHAKVEVFFTSACHTVDTTQHGVGGVAINMYHVWTRCFHPTMVEMLICSLWIRFRLLCFCASSVAIVGCDRTIPWLVRTIPWLVLKAQWFWILWLGLCLIRASKRTLSVF